MKNLALAGLSFLIVIPAVSAEPLPLARDTVTLSMQSEGWVTTQSANVDAFFNITQQRESASDLKMQIKASLEKLAPKANWYVTSTRVNKDNTGLNRWYVSAKARVSEMAISSLGDRAVSASRSGFKVSIGHVDFSPTLEETNALMADLRTKIYADAALEAERLSTAISGAKYHVQSVNFLNVAGDYPRPMVQMRSKNMAVQEMSVSSGNSPQSTAQCLSQKNTN
ncbi:MAG: SIMPL domain-containing protein, partial [Sneathiella sp.]|nr:SIMPL domain-containing protein [Sneathiella sp.]